MVALCALMSPGPSADAGQVSVNDRYHLSPGGDTPPTGTDGDLGYPQVGGGVSRESEGYIQFGIGEYRDREGYIEIGIGNYRDGEGYIQFGIGEYRFSASYGTE